MELGKQFLSFTYLETKKSVVPSVCAQCTGDVHPTPSKEMETQENRLGLHSSFSPMEDFCSCLFPSLQSPLGQLGGCSPRRIISLKLEAVAILACAGLGLAMELEF